jgi:hypothetical protein
MSSLLMLQHTARGRWGYLMAKFNLEFVGQWGRRPIPLSTADPVLDTGESIQLETVQQGGDSIHAAPIVASHPGISRIEVTAYWHRTFGGGSSWASIATPIIPPGSDGGGIIETGTVDDYFCDPGIHDACGWGIFVHGSPPASVSYSDWCGNQHVDDWLDYPEYTGVHGTVQVRTAIGSNSAPQQLAFTSTPTPAEACSAAVGDDPFTYETITALTEWKRSSGLPWECTDKAAYTTAPTEIDVNLYASVLQSIDDYWVEMGGGNITVRGIRLFYTVNAPYSSYDGASLDDEIQAFVNGGSRQTLEDAVLIGVT